MERFRDVKKFYHHRTGWNHGRNWGIKLMLSNIDIGRGRIYVQWFDEFEETLAWRCYVLEARRWKLQGILLYHWIFHWLCHIDSVVFCYDSLSRGGTGMKNQVLVGYWVFKKLQVRVESGSRKTLPENNCITSEVIHRHEGLEYVSTTTPNFSMATEFFSIFIMWRGSNQSPFPFGSGIEEQIPVLAGRIQIPVPALVQIVVLKFSAALAAHTVNARHEATQVIGKWPLSPLSRGLWEIRNLASWWGLTAAWIGD